MKKAFISIALAAALFCGANAQTTATVPSWYSYQGVCDVPNKNVEVVFYIVKGADATPVYAESHHVNTNAAGAFSCQLGLGTLESVNNYDTFKSISEINWEEGPYSVQTYIDGTLVGTAELGSVPYATLAGKALGIAGVDGNLNEIIEELYLRDEQNDENLSFAIRAQAAVDEEQNANIEGAFTYMEEQLANLNPLWGMVADLDEKVETNIEGLAEAEKAISEISEEMPGIKGNLEAVKAEVETNIEGLANAETAIFELTEQVRSNTAAIALLGGAGEVDLTEVNANIELLFDGLTETQKDVIGLTEQVRSNTAGVAKLQEDVDINIAGLAEAEKAISEISEVLPGMTGSIETLKQEVELQSKR
ncbi:MAG: hypothetical protein K2K37_06635, partial [Muribaculaceae bacterium]|nr:hypothetical protein [Muribaculaceae bacterium]